MFAELSEELKNQRTKTNLQNLEINALKNKTATQNITIFRLLHANAMQRESINSEKEALELYKRENEQFNEIEKFRFLQLINETQSLRAILDSHKSKIDDDGQRTRLLAEKLNNLTRSQIAEESIKHLIQVSKMNLARTCQHLAMYGVTKSAKYDIDPDGILYGSESIEVYCDFTTNTTHILHDEPIIQVEKCDGYGCSKSNITYSTPKSQIDELINLSETCTQTIDISCFSAPLLDKDGNRAWWIDSNGLKHYFFNGDFENEHTCQCGKFFNEIKHPIQF